MAIEQGDAKSAGGNGTTERVRPLFAVSPPSLGEEPQVKLADAVKSPNGALVVCAGVKLKGRIGSCDTLMVEGEVNAKLRARQIAISSRGAVTGKAEAEEAEVAGRFEGTLHIAGKLVIRRTGRVSGRISYGQLEIEPGGELRGHVAMQAPLRKRA